MCQVTSSFVHRVFPLFSVEFKILFMTIVLDSYVFFSLKIFSSNLGDQNKYYQIKDDLTHKIEELSRAIIFKQNLLVLNNISLRYDLHQILNSGHSKYR